MSLKIYWHVLLNVIGLAFNQWADMANYLTAFSILRPKYELSQSSIFDWILEAHERAEKAKTTELKEGWRDDLKARLQKIGMGTEMIQQRGVHLEDLCHRDWEKMQIYPLTPHSPSGTPLKERMKFFDAACSAVFEQFYPENAPIAPHLFHVSCTGYVSPSPAQKIVAKRDAENKTVVTHAYHMGCYAAIPAIRLGMGSLTDIVHTELASVHFNPLLHTSEQLVVQSLFADGFAKYSIVQDKQKKAALQVLALHEVILPDSDHCMSWQCEEWGFKMTLAKELPVIIRNALDTFLVELAKKSGHSLSELKEKGYFAVHPGGPKIIKQVEELFDLKPWQLTHSREILKTCGNMSSATLPHIWQKILIDSTVQPGALIISLAFGPGLTMCGAIFEKEI